MKKYGKNKAKDITKDYSDKKTFDSGSKLSKSIRVEENFQISETKSKPIGKSAFVAKGTNTETKNESQEETKDLKISTIFRNKSKLAESGNDSNTISESKYSLKNAKNIKSSKNIKNNEKEKDEIIENESKLRTDKSKKEIHPKKLAFDRKTDQKNILEKPKIERKERKFGKF